jgi:hypothetical protein
MVLDVSRLLAVPTDFDELLCRIAQACTVCSAASGRASSSTTAHERAVDEGALGSGEIRFPCSKGIAGYCFTRGRGRLRGRPLPRPAVQPRARPQERVRHAQPADRPDCSTSTASPLGRDPGGQQDRRPVRDSDSRWSNCSPNRRAWRAAAQPPAGRRWRNLALRHEMDLARATQQALIPRHPPKLPWVDACGWNCPASVTGGDCWDMWTLPDGPLGIFLADASGHGIGPGPGRLAGAHARPRDQRDRPRPPRPARARQRPPRRGPRVGRFVTAFLGVLGPDGWLHWSSAGHGPALVPRTARRAAAGPRPARAAARRGRWWARTRPTPSASAPAARSCSSATASSSR